MFTTCLDTVYNEFKGVPSLKMKEHAKSARIFKVDLKYQIPVRRDSRRHQSIENYLYIVDTHFNHK